MIPFVREMRFEYGACDQVSPLIRRVVARNPGRFTFLGTGTYIVGHGDVAIIDPGPPMDEHLDALRRAVEGERVTHIVLTHTHADHSPLAAPLSELTGARIWGRVPEDRSDALAGTSTVDTPVTHIDVIVSDGHAISGNGWTLKAITTPGHASNHVCYALPEENALFSGDHIMGWATTVVTLPDGDMAAYYASLDKVFAGDFATLWPTHGPPVTAVSSFVSAYKEHRLERERQVVAQLHQGARTIDAIVAHMYADVDIAMHPVAARNVLAHLVHLIQRGFVTCEGELTPRSEFRLTADARKS